MPVSERNPAGHHAPRTTGGDSTRRIQRLLKRRVSEAADSQNLVVLDLHHPVNCAARYKILIISKVVSSATEVYPLFRSDSPLQLQYEFVDGHRTVSFGVRPRYRRSVSLPVSVIYLRGLGKLQIWFRLPNRPSVRRPG